MVFYGSLYIITRAVKVVIFLIENIVGSFFGCNVIRYTTERKLFSIHCPDRTRIPGGVLEKVTFEGYKFIDTTIGSVISTILDPKIILVVVGLIFTFYYYKKWRDIYWLRKLTLIPISIGLTLIIVSVYNNFNQRKVEYKELNEKVNLIKTTINGNP